MSSGPISVHDIYDDEPTMTGLICKACGSSRFETASAPIGIQRARCGHNDLVRTVALGKDFVLSGSYDLSIKVSQLIQLENLN